MAFNRGLLLAFMVSLMSLCGASSGAVYRVGDSAGWTLMGAVNYNYWASSKTFHVGDTIVFQYDTLRHNVKQVTHDDFQSCNVSNPMATYSSGSDSVTLKRPTNLYFTCGVPGHCEAGQKVAIRVLPAFLGPLGSPKSGPSSSPSGFDYVTSGSTSIPAHNSATATLYYSSLGSLVLVVVGVLTVAFA